MVKTAELRDAMVARVRVTVEKWPTLDKMPVGGKVGAGMELVTRPVETTKDNGGYVAALHELCLQSTPIGRSKDGDEIYGERPARKPVAPREQPA